MLCKKNQKEDILQNMSLKESECTPIMVIYYPKEYKIILIKLISSLVKTLLRLKQSKSFYSGDELSNQKGEHNPHGGSESDSSSHLVDVDLFTITESTRECGSKLRCA